MFPVNRGLIFEVEVTVFKRMLVLSMCFSLSGAAWTVYGAAELFKEGPFAVRKVEGGCKLETNLLAKEQKPAPKENPEEVMGILALFSSDKFYSELFTSRKKVGQAQKMVKVGFDAEKLVDYSFAAQPGNDDHWRWQYLDNTKGLLEGIGSKKNMNLEFSNGKTTYHFEIPMKGGDKALAALKKCSGEKGEPEPAKKEPPPKEPVKKEPVKKEPVKKEPAKKEPAKKEPAKKEPAKKEPASKDKEPAKKNN